MHALLAAIALSLVPLHGVVLDVPGHGSAVVRNDPVPRTIPAEIRRYRLDPAISVAPGVGLDGYLDRSTRPWTLRDPAIAAQFSPGVPNTASVLPVDVGTPLPPTMLVDQNGRLLRLDRAFAGKTVLLSFVFTRCPDRTLCPAISGKYAYLQAHLDPAHYALVEITLDPPYDSPRVLRAYGAQFGANPAIWHLLTGKGSVIQRALNEFGIDSLRVSSSNFIHSDKLFIVSPQGQVAYLVTTAGWEPDGVLAEARAIAGVASNPFERLKLSLIASVVAVCGGSQFAGVVLLEIGLFFLITLVVIVCLSIVARILWRKEPGREG